MHWVCSLDVHAERHLGYNFQMTGSGKVWLLQLLVDLFLQAVVLFSGIGHYGGGRYGGGRYGGRRYGGGHYGGNLPKGGHYGGKEIVTHISEILNFPFIK